ncbi:hypothetical protein [Mucilaginibacter endophyticus]|uniref:hypothetical protein n=1 Tax=Mucilaginibacter endophyticus TaxID=2675003 RepID=UPI000E0DA9B0|nr:hypothetical protein [Mucilaginibacter endophyticus]
MPLLKKVPPTGLPLDAILLPILDLVYRFQNRYELKAYDRDNLYGGDARCYIDYPVYEERLSA